MPIRYQVDALEVQDTAAFGEAVIKIALGNGPKGPMTVADFRATYPQAWAALALPAGGVPDDDTVTVIQGTTSNHIVNVPPLHKLLPMIEALGKEPTNFVPASDLGFDPLDPPKVGTKTVPPQPFPYPFPAYYIQLLSGYGGANPMSEFDIFLNRVGDYAVAGCR